MLISTSRLWQLRLLVHHGLAAAAPPPSPPLPPPPRRQQIAAAAAEQHATEPAPSAQAVGSEQLQRQGKLRSKRHGSDAAGAAAHGGASGEGASQGKQQKRQRATKPVQPRKSQKQPKPQQPKQPQQDEQQPQQQAQQQQSQKQQPRRRSQEPQRQRRQLQQRTAAQPPAEQPGSLAAVASKQRGEKQQQSGHQAAVPGKHPPPQKPQPQRRSTEQQPSAPQQQPQQGQARQGSSSALLVSGRMRAQAGGPSALALPAALPRQQAASRDGSSTNRSSGSGSSSGGSGSGSGSGSTAPDGGASTSRQRRRVAAAILRQKFADALLAGQQALGIPLDSKATDVLRQLSQSSDRHVVNTLERVSRQAGRQTDKQRARQQQRDLLRARLTNLQQRQQRVAQQAGAAGEGRSSSGDTTGAPQPVWGIEAAEALCNVGLSAEEAAAALLAAQAYRVKRLQALAGSTQAGAGAAAVQAQQAAAAAAAAAHGSPSSGDGPSRPAAAAAAAAGPAADGREPLSAAEVEAVCSVLLDAAKLGIAELRPALVAAPQLLACSPAEMRKQHTMLASVWRQPRRLSAAIAKHPAMLAPGFPAALGASLRELSALGMRKDQVSATILRCPAVTKYTRQQIAANLMSVGLDLSTAPMNVLQFLSDHPWLLTPEGAPELGSKLRLFGSWRLPPPMCPLLLARCPGLLKESEDQLQAVVDIFLGYGITWPDLHAVLLGYPPVLRADTNIVRLTLKLLADFEIDFGRVVRYPRVFIHDPVQVIGPRLAYLAAFKPGHLSYQLVSLLSRSDDEFASLVCRRLPDEYAVFKDAWVRQFYEQVAAPASRGGGAGQRPNTLSQRLWSREVTDELWL